MPIKTPLIPIIALGVLGLTLGCQPKEKPIARLEPVTQDLSAFIPTGKMDKQLVNPDFQAYLHDRFLDLFTRPWSGTKPALSVKKLQRSYANVKANPGYNEIKQKRPVEEIRDLETYSDLDGYPNQSYRAITVSATNVRALPTHKPYFSSVSKPGKGFPFDLFQYSRLPVNTPMRIVHHAKDGAWAFADTPFFSGWVPVQDIAQVSTPSVTQFKTATHCVTVVDRAPVYNAEKQFVFYAKIGARFIMGTASANAQEIFYASKQPDGTATFAQGWVSPNVVSPAPLPISWGRLSAIGNQMLGQYYGWGGQFGNRDCSAMLQDLFAPFGLFLPRNSTSQATQGGQYIGLSQLTVQDKKAMIKKNAIPYLTLLWFPGHIMLYVGTDKDEIIVFHNIWGLKSDASVGPAGRFLIGKSILSTIDLVNHTPGTKRNSDFVKRLNGMTLLIPRGLMYRP